ncbi:hypothetical protein [Agaribacter flavus]|uniref:Uncharacterized protein n=1 Tax=Agaribacter flavus TaxID=1902781 RepID=A0ABV7FU74_9ALTE
MPNKKGGCDLSGLVNELNVRIPILRDITSEQDHQQALSLMEELIEDYDTNLVVIEALSNAITRYEAEAASFSEFNQRSEAEDPAVATLRVLMDQYDLNTTDFKN